MTRKRPRSWTPLILLMTETICVALFFERPQIIAIDLDGEFALDAADGLFNIVRDGLGEVPEDAGHLFELAVHGRDEFVFILLEDGAPFLFGLEVDKVFGVEKARSIGSIVRTTGLADNFE